MEYGLTRKFGFLLLSAQSLLLSHLSFGQNDLQQMLLKASQAFVGTQSASAATLTGQVEVYAGSAQETGSVTLVAHSDGSSSMNLQLGSGARAETQNTFSNGQGCSWSAEDGVAHPSAAHNCQLPLAWFLPEVAFFSAQLPTSGATTLLPGSNTVHWSKLTPTSATADLTSLLGHIGQYDLEFDPSTFLPSRLSYAAHPDANAGVDIPVSIAYSDYRTVNGVAIPFRIQRYFNGTLSLDISLSDAVISH